MQKESQYFLVEYYPSLEKKPQGQGPFQKSDDRNKRKGKRGRRGPSRGGESSQQRLEGSSEGQPSSDSPKRARRPFRPRNQSQTQPQQPGTGPKIIIKPVTPITQVTAPSAEPAPAVLAEPTPSAT